MYKCRCFAVFTALMDNYILMLSLLTFNPCFVTSLLFSERKLTVLIGNIPSSVTFSFFRRVVRNASDPSSTKGLRNFRQLKKAPRKGPYFFASYLQHVRYELFARSLRQITRRDVEYSPASCHTFCSHSDCRPCYCRQDASCEVRI